MREVAVRISRRPWWAASGLVGASGGIAALTLYLSSLAPTITLANGAGDSGELASTAYTLGIAHPTGYPLYTMLGFVVTHLFAVEPARALNAFSALSAAVAVALAAMTGSALARCALPQAPRRAALGGVLAAASLAIAPMFWTEAVVTETRALTMAQLALVLALLLGPRQLTRRGAVLAAFLYGLALCNHLLALYLCPAVAVLLWPWATARPRRWALLAGAVLVGLTPYLYLPWRAAMGPPANWGDPTTLERALWLVSGQQYHYLMFATGISGLPRAIWTELAAVCQELNPLTSAAALLGVGVVLRRVPRIGWALLGTFALDLTATANYGAQAAPAYLLLGLLCAVLAAAVGWCAIAAGLALTLRRALPARSASLMAMALVGGAYLVAARGPYLVGAAAVAASASAADRDRGLSILESLPAGAVILASDDSGVMPLWYAQRGLRRRPDVAIVATGLLQYAWYYDQVRRLPALDSAALPPSAVSADGYAGFFGLGPRRLRLVAGALRRGHALYMTSPENALSAVCHPRPAGLIYRCR